MARPRTGQAVAGPIGLKPLRGAKPWLDHASVAHASPGMWVLSCANYKPRLPLVGPEFKPSCPKHIHPTFPNPREDPRPAQFRNQRRVTGPLRTGPHRHAGDSDAARCDGSNKRTHDATCAHRHVGTKKRPSTGFPAGCPKKLAKHCLPGGCPPTKRAQTLPTTVEHAQAYNNSPTTYNQHMPRESKQTRKQANAEHGVQKQGLPGKQTLS